MNHVSNFDIFRLNCTPRYKLVFFGIAFFASYHKGQVYNRGILNNHSFTGRPTLSIRGNTDIPIGSDASFRCDVSLSNPSVQRILWRKGAVSKSEQGGLANGGKYVIKQSHYSSTLKVISVNISDADTYTCVANNNFSEGIDTIILSVGSEYFEVFLKIKRENRHFLK